MDEAINANLVSGDIIVSFNIPGLPEPVQVPFSEFDSFHKDQLIGVIILGVTIGACSLLLILLLGMLYKSREKYWKSLLFMLNVCILAATILRSGCFLDYYLSDLASISYTFTGVYNGTSFASSDAANVFKTIMFALIETSLTFQVYVMFQGTTWKNWGHAVTALSGLLSVASVAFQIYTTILSHNNFNATISGTGTLTSGVWMDLPTLLFAASINFMTILLLFKLGMAIRQRRYLGLKQFDGFHILFIMFTQTLFIPSILLVIHYFYQAMSGPFIINMALFLVVAFLPLSSLWAQTANTTKKIESSPSMSFITRRKSEDESPSAANDEDRLRKFTTTLDLSGNKNNTTNNNNNSNNINNNMSNINYPSTGSGEDDKSFIFEMEPSRERAAIEEIDLGARIDTGLPRDLEKFLVDGFDDSDDGEGMIAREVTMLKK
ncbi:pheromone alpha factor receptor [Lodderomyces elongisporus]|uniref:pheromone alpha factor receptor n=1 Tax=Lodderomyces elongisporus TaxID=36914 RepID=UPI002923B85E|nr:pheromone alpha factor receptor [Lodderomyces elongisporus]WLF79170.1 pheromone alpha factor receptor [Lodderomyces elongisporus]